MKWGTRAEALDKQKMNYRLLVMPDHPTPIRVRTHTAESVPYLLYDSAHPQSENHHYNEKEAGESGNFISQGHTIIDRLLNR